MPVFEAFRRLFAFARVKLRYRDFDIAEIIEPGCGVKAAEKTSIRFPLCFSG